MKVVLAERSDALRAAVMMVSLFVCMMGLILNGGR